MADPGPAPDWERLPWDTACFGIPTARLRTGLPRPALEAALAAMRAAGLRLAYGNADPADADARSAAADLGGVQVDERRLYLLDPLPDGPLGTGRAVAAAGRGWEEALESLALHAGGHSRFRVDPRFPPEGFRRLYLEWIRKSLAGERADAVLALPGADGPEGMVTVTARDGAGDIGLIAVAPGREGMGLGSELMRAALAWFRERGCARATVVTQGANRAACALYERHGYRVARSELVHHFWL